MKRVIWISVALLLVVAIVGGAIWGANRPKLVETAVVEKQTVSEYVDERAKTQLSRTYVISMPFAGRIEPIDLEVGDRVKKDAVVAQLEGRELSESVAEVSAEVERIKASIRENEDSSIEQTSLKQARKLIDSMSLTVKAADTRTRATKRRWEYARSFLKRIQELVVVNAKSKDQLERAQVTAVESEISHRQDELNAKAVDSMSAAMKLLPELITRWIERKKLSRNVLLQQLEGAQVRLNRATRLWKQRLLRSPVDGVVLKRHATNRRYLVAGQVLLTIGRPTDLQFEAEVLSDEVVGIKKGLPAEVYGGSIGAIPGRGTLAKVFRVDPLGFTKVSSLGVEQQRVRVVVRCDARQLQQLAEQGIGAGFQVRVRIFTKRKSDALAIPTTALFRGPQAEWQVYVIRNGRAVLQTIELGMQNDTQAEVTKGLTSGESVIVAPDSTIKNGTLVKSRTS